MKVKQEKSAKRLSRRNILKYGLYGGMMAGLAPSLWLSGCRKQWSSKRPNIIFILIDTFRADHVGCYGYKRNTTPNIDALARQGILFKNAIVAAPWTLPSVASIITSQYPSVLGIRDRTTVVTEKFPIFSQALKKHNYITCGIVSHTLLSARLGFGRGFDWYDEKSSLGHGGFSSPTVTSKAISFVRQKHESPFFLFAHYFDPHYHYMLHKKYDYYSSYKGAIKSGHSILDLWRRRGNLTTDDIKYLIALYDSEIAFTDEHVGLLLGEVKQQGLYDESIIIVTADHGEEFMERGWLGHTITLNQELIRVPLIMKLPGYKAKVLDSAVGLIDIVPTLYDYLGIGADNHLDGEALDISGNDAIKRRPIFSETFNPQIHQPGHVNPIALRSIVLDKQKLIYDEIKGAAKIYNLSVDPDEQVDLSSQVGEQNNRLKALLSQWIDYASMQETRGPVYGEQELFTPEQRKQLKSLGYL
jgi:arylsulfatase A-like enzyme